MDWGLLLIILLNACTAGVALVQYTDYCKRRRFQVRTMSERRRTRAPDPPITLRSIDSFMSKRTAS